MSTPSSVINICSGVHLNNKYEHTIWFDSVAAQNEYFAGKVVKTFSAYSYLRKNWNIKVVTTMEEAKSWTYLFFKNGTGRTYYYFITNIEYINDNTVELMLELDVMQTYHFIYQQQMCFVEREHTANDNIGVNLVEEGLDVGEIVTIDESYISLNNMCILVMANIDPSIVGKSKVLGARYSGIYSGAAIYAVKMSQWADWAVRLNELDEEGVSDGILTMWMYPIDLVNLKDGFTWDDENLIKDVNQIDTLNALFHDVSRNDKTSGSYTPRNNKLLTYPYNFLYVTNNSGASAVYRYESFGDPTFCNFKVIGAATPEGGVKMYPLNYKGQANNYEEGMVLSGFPTCAWNSDVYKLWLAQNQNQMGLTTATAILKIAGGLTTTAVTGGTAGMVGLGTAASGLADITGMLAQKADKMIEPPQSKGQQSVSVNVANDFQTFTFLRKSLTKEYAQIIDGYFDKYGYATKRVKYPNRNVRENWTYVKTVDCHVTGNICTEDQDKIESIYNHGITFWKNGDEIGNYSLSNTIL